MTHYLTLAEVLTIHYQLIEHYGGSHGLRDPGALEAALYRPQTGYYSDLIQEAAALWESLSQNHPFLDGNKRIALAATTVFLAINEQPLQVHDPDTVFTWIDAELRQGTFDFKTIEAWLRAHLP